jgi:hypothetical protein
MRPTRPTNFLKAVDHRTGFTMPDPRSSILRKPRHRRLWPLLSLPFLGLLAGLDLEAARIHMPLVFGKLDLMGSVALGLLAGCGAMVISATVVLAYRISQRRFTIGAILVTIAVIAVLLFGTRSLLGT